MGKPSSVWGYEISDMRSAEQNCMSLFQKLLEGNKGIYSGVSAGPAEPRLSVNYIIFQKSHRHIVQNRSKGPIRGEGRGGHL